MFDNEDWEKNTKVSSMENNETLKLRNEKGNE